jgi:hypothetical protein
MQSASSQSRPRRSAGFPVPLAAFFAAVGSFAVSYLVFDERGLMNSWHCGASDCDTVGMGA